MYITITDIRPAIRSAAWSQASGSRDANVAIAFETRSIATPSPIRTPEILIAAFTSCPPVYLERSARPAVKPPIISANTAIAPTADHNFFISGTDDSTYIAAASKTIDLAIV